MKPWMAVLAVALTATPAFAEAPLASLSGAVNAPQAREAIARVAYAEAANQGEAGLAGVVFTILNRLASDGWGSSVESVLNARAQFEPVLRAGGDWRGLSPASAAQRAKIDTILNLALEGRLPDPTGGARYFQNAEIVAARARAGTVSPRLVHFGGAAPSARIGAHTFYVGADLAPAVGAVASREIGATGGAIFFSPPAAGSSGVKQAIPAIPQRPSEAPAGVRGLFVLPDGQIIEDASQAAP